MAMAVVTTGAVHAQGVSVTYNHDSPKQNQVTVMETCLLYTSDAADE